MLALFFPICFSREFLPKVTTFYTAGYRISTIKSVYPVHPYIHKFFLTEIFSPFFNLFWSQLSFQFLITLICDRIIESSDIRSIPKDQPCSIMDILALFFPICFAVNYLPNARTLHDIMSRLGFMIIKIKNGTDLQEREKNRYYPRLREPNFLSQY